MWILTWRYRMCVMTCLLVSLFWAIKCSLILIVKTFVQLTVIAFLVFDYAVTSGCLLLPIDYKNSSAVQQGNGVRRMIIKLIRQASRRVIGSSTQAGKSKLIDEEVWRTLNATEPSQVEPESHEEPAKPSRDIQRRAKTAEKEQHLRAAKIWYDWWGKKAALYTSKRCENEAEWWTVDTF